MKNVERCGLDVPGDPDRATTREQLTDNVVAEVSGGAGDKHGVVRHNSLYFNGDKSRVPPIRWTVRLPRRF
jgi:hypothetical protein